MQVLVVTFTLDGLAHDAYVDASAQEAPMFAEVPGLIAKIWLADAESNTYGGIYTFRDRASMDAYLSSELFRELKGSPAFVDVKADTYSVLEAPTTITRGWAGATA